MRMKLNKNDVSLRFLCRAKRTFMGLLNTKLRMMSGR